MPSKRRQLNVRLTPEGEALLDALAEAMRRELGINLSQSDVVQAGLSELKKKYVPGWTYAPPADAPAPAKRGRPAKPRAGDSQPPPGGGEGKAKKGKRTEG